MCLTGTEAELSGPCALLLALCSDGPPAASKAAPRALVALLGREAAAGKLEPVAKQLSARLARAGGASESKLPVTMAALSAIGRTLPQVFPPS